MRPRQHQADSGSESESRVSEWSSHRIPRQKVVRRPDHRAHFLSASVPTQAFVLRIAGNRSVMVWVSMTSIEDEPYKR